MSISMVRQSGSVVIVYDENNRVLYNDIGELHGYTSSTVTIKKGSLLHTYNEKRQLLGTQYV